MANYRLQNIVHNLLGDEYLVVSGIYGIFSPTGAAYIGQSLNIRNRWYLYSTLRCKTQPRIYRSLFKHSPEKHEYKLLHQLPLDSSAEVFNNYERIYIDLYKSAGFDLMNLDLSCENFKRSPDTLKKISKSLTGKKLSEKHRESIRKANTGKKQSQETIKKIVESRKRGGYVNPYKGKKQPAEFVEKRRLSMIGKRLGYKTPIETIEKIKNTRRLNPYKHSEESKIKIGIASKGHTLPIEARIKISQKATERQKLNPKFNISLDYYGEEMSIRRICEMEKIKERDLRYLVLEKNHPLSVRSAIIFIKSNSNYAKELHDTNFVINRSCLQFNQIQHRRP